MSSGAQAGSAARATWPPASHEDIFISRYDRLRSWALRLADGDRAESEDLLHDAFIEFVRRRRDLAEIQNLDAYLYGLLRRLRLSRRRAVLRTREDPLSVLDFDTAELSLRTLDARAQLQARDELRAVCDYACARKEASKTGSVLLLRFFHGFFPTEIATILNCPVRGANDWLRLARREARAYLANPSTPRSTGSRVVDALDVLDDLRRTIRQARRGPCQHRDALARLYAPGCRDTMSARILAHVVSCPGCLDRLTALLGMQPPGDRDPHDMLGPDAGGRARRRSMRLPNGLSSTMLRRWSRELRGLSFHEPSELLVAANGIALGSLPIAAAGANALLLHASVGEPLEFIEVLSEQGIRLLMMEAEVGGVERVEHVELSGGSISLRVAPFEAGCAVTITCTQPAVDGAASEAAVAKAGVLDEVAGVSPVDRIRSWIDVLRTVAHLPRPAYGIAALVAVVALWSIASWRTNAVSAAEILGHTRSIEVTASSAPNVVVHRVLQVTERRLPAGTIHARRRIEQWRAVGQHITARRVYDERNRLLGGEWIADDGARTVYRPGVSPSVSQSGGAPITPEAMWRWEPSAEDFARLVGQIESASVEERDGRYVISYRSSLAPDADGLMEATLVVTKAPLRAVEQRLVLRTSGVLTEFHFTETERAEIPVARVPAAALIPEPELTAAPAAPVAPPSDRVREVPSAVQLPGLDPAERDWHEVDALFALHRLERCLEGPADIDPSPSGRLVVRAAPVGEQCRGEVNRALRAIAGVEPTLMVVDRARHESRGPFADQHFGMGDGVRAVAAAFERGGVAADAAQVAARAFAAWAVEHSARAVDDTRHLEQLTERWPMERLSALDPDRVARWQDVVRDHARRAGRSMQALRVQLNGFLPEGVVTADHADAGGSGAGIADIEPAVRRLASLARAQHDAIARMFGEAAATREPVGPADLARVLRAGEVQAAWFDEPWIIESRR